MGAFSESRCIGSFSYLAAVLRPTSCSTAIYRESVVNRNQSNEMLSLRRLVTPAVELPLLGYMDISFYLCQRHSVENTVLVFPLKSYLFVRSVISSIQIVDALLLNAVSLETGKVDFNWQIDFGKVNWQLSWLHDVTYNQTQRVVRSDTQWSINHLWLPRHSWLIAVRQNRNIVWLW